jgi:cobalt-zinc-cadmium efflux system outer membrane protein
VIHNHPERSAAEMGVEQARFLVQRAKAEPIPNVTVSSGFTRQNQNRSSDWLIGVSLPVPTWNRNQGNIKEACANLASATREIQRVENDLASRLATACREYSAARQRAIRYRDAVLPKAEESYRLSLQAYRGGQFEYLRVLQAQRVVFETRLEYNRSLGEAWQAAAKISGLTLEENWPARVAK